MRMVRENPVFVREFKIDGSKKRVGSSLLINGSRSPMDKYRVQVSITRDHKHAHLSSFAAVQPPFRPADTMKFIHHPFVPFFDTLPTVLAHTRFTMYTYLWAEYLYRRVGKSRTKLFNQCSSDSRKSRIKLELPVSRLPLEFLPEFSRNTRKPRERAYAYFLPKIQIGHE